MHNAIAILDLIAGLVLAFGLITFKFIDLPNIDLHDPGIRFGVFLLAVGLLSQSLIEWAHLDRAAVPVWALKDAGVWWLVGCYAVLKFRIG